MKRLNVLIACEESGAVRDEFCKLGHNAWSCDLQPCDPNALFPHRHIKNDALITMAAGPPGRRSKPWDLLIAHPPCTYLCNSGVRWLFANPDKPQTHQGYLTKKYRVAKTKGWGWIDGYITRPVNGARVRAMEAAAAFFMRFWISGIAHIAIENPIMHQYGRKAALAGKPTQIVQPWMFGHCENKATCLWLKNLPKLSYNIPAAKATRHAMKFMTRAQTNRIHYASPGPDRAKLRSKTYPGIALAMATQWSEYIENL